MVMIPDPLHDEPRSCGTSSIAEMTNPAVDPTSAALAFALNPTMTREDTIREICISDRFDVTH